MAKKSVDQRLFEAFSRFEGVRLTADDVQELLGDDAVGRRVTNKACIEAGIQECGEDSVPGRRVCETWHQFKQRLIEAYG